MKREESDLIYIKGISNKKELFNKNSSIIYISEIDKLLTNKVHSNINRFRLLNIKKEDNIGIIININKLYKELGLVYNKKENPGDFSIFLVNEGENSKHRIKIIKSKSIKIIGILIVKESIIIIEDSNKLLKLEVIINKGLYGISIKSNILGNMVESIYIILVYKLNLINKFNIS